MSEPEVTAGAKEKADNTRSHRVGTSTSKEENDISQTYVRTPEPFRNVSPLVKRDATTFIPSWLRPFFSLRVQLLSVFTLLLILVVTLTCVLLYQQVSFTYIVLIALSVVVIGSVLAFIFISLLLQPLWQVTDASQAIALGDLAQRERLPMRLPPQDEIDRLSGSLNEMVARLEYAEEIQRVSEQSFRRFFSDASHQLRTPLTSIRGFTELLMRGAKDDPETAQHVLKRMKSEAERMTALINDLLTLARLDDGRPLKMQYLDLVEIAIESIEQTRSRANDDRAISFNVITQERVGLQGDRDRIKQLLFVLLDNALKYGRATPDGKIILQLDKQAGQSVIRVIDNGQGISQEELEHIFDSFYRGQHPSISGTSVAGAGLGLTIANAIVRAHRGTITARSEPNKGTEFSVMFPCVG